MTLISVQFRYFTGIQQGVFRNARLLGSWDDMGRYSEQWSSIPMEPVIGEDGCPSFRAIAHLDSAEINREFRWGVMLDGPAGCHLWGIATEVSDVNSMERYRTFQLKNLGEGRSQEEGYYLSQSRRLGAQKYYPFESSDPAIQFAVWAPNAQQVAIVFGTANGYIADDGSGIDPSLGTLTMMRLEDGVWITDPQDSQLRDFSQFDHKPYMFRIVKEDGQVAYRTDLYSRCQIGKGTYNPQGNSYLGLATDLDGTKSCSVIIDPDQVAKNFLEDVWPEHEFIDSSEFWQDEFSHTKPLPNRVEDLVIYELHIGALGFGHEGPGTFADAMQLLDYLEDLGVNAVELLPMAEFRDTVNWGYETSHYFALEYSAGGRDQLKHFIRACHRRGIAVILDVVYNHFSPDAERAEWNFDSDYPENNIYYWYEGSPANYPQADGGYIDNMSSGFAPRFREEMVRKLFISSAVALVEEFHVDGFRVDQTTSIHGYNVLHADGRLMGNVNVFGAKFLREWSRTLRLIKPHILLMAEDHSDWNLVTESTEQGGLGFDARWFAEFYHHLIGDTRQGTEYAKLIPTAGLGGNEPLAMDRFSRVLAESGHRKVVYHESHDEAGNSYYVEGGQRIESKRTIMSASNGAPLIGETRRYAEARSRFAIGMSLLSAGTPMFLMGEEIGAQKPYRYGDFLENREDLFGERTGHGKQLFRFYQDLIQLRINRYNTALRSHEIDLIHVHNANRVIAFRRWDGTGEFLIAATLNNQHFSQGYTLDNARIGNGNWQEIFNSDAEVYGGDNVGNAGRSIPSTEGQISLVIPANGFVVLQKMISSP